MEQTQNLINIIIGCNGNIEFEKIEFQNLLNYAEEYDLEIRYGLFLYKETTLFKVKYGEDYVGILSIDKYNEHNNKNPFITNFEISEKYRGKGIGTKVIEKICDEYDRRNIYLTPLNFKSAKFWRKFSNIIIVK